MWTSLFSHLWNCDSRTASGTSGERMADREVRARSRGAHLSGSDKKGKGHAELTNRIDRLLPIVLSVAGISLIMLVSIVAYFATNPNGIPTTLEIQVLVCPLLKEILELKLFFFFPHTAQTNQMREKSLDGWFHFSTLHGEPLISTSPFFWIPERASCTMEMSLTRRIRGTNPLSFRLARRRWLKVFWSGDDTLFICPTISSFRLGARLARNVYWRKEETCYSTWFGLWWARDAKDPPLVHSGLWDRVDGYQQLEGQSAISTYWARDW